MSDVGHGPRFQARAVLFDVDETIVTQIAGGESDVFMKVLCEQIAARDGSSDEAARTALLATWDPQRDQLKQALMHYNIDPVVYEAEVCKRIRPFVRGYPDAVKTVQTLHDRGYTLYPATTNGAMACRIKLGAVGLTDEDGPGYFCELFGGDEVESAGKTTPAFYTALLRRIGLAAEDVVMVGDHPQFDLGLARQAGIEQVVLPRRSQSEDVMIEPDGGVYVRSLESLLTMLPARPVVEETSRG